MPLRTDSGLSGVKGVAMAQMIGADPAQLDAFGGRMDSAADQLDRIRTTISSLLANSHWVGRDADVFRNDWQLHLAGRLTGVAGSARHAAVTIRTQAEQQRLASQAGGPGGSGWFGSLPGVGLKDWLDAYGDAKMPWEGVLNLLQRGLLGAGLAGWLARGPLAGLAKHLPSAINNVFVKDLDKATGLLGKFARSVGKVGDAIQVGSDLMDFGRVLADGKLDAEDLKSGVSLALSIASVATPLPVSLAIDAAGFVFKDLTSDGPNLTKTVVSGIGHVAADIWKLGPGDELIENAADTARVVTGGFNAVKNLFR